MCLDKCIGAEQFYAELPEVFIAWKALCGVKGMHVREYVYQPGLNKAQPLSARDQRILGPHLWGDSDTELEVPASGGLGVFIEEIRPWMQYNGHRIGISQSRLHQSVLRSRQRRSQGCLQQVRRHLCPFR